MVGHIWKKGKEDMVRETFQWCRRFGKPRNTRIELGGTGQIFEEINKEIGRAPQRGTDRIEPCKSYID